MSTTFVEIAGKGFWISDNLLEPWLRLAALHIEETPECARTAHAIRDQWLLASRGYFSAHVPVALDAFVADAEARRIILTAIASLRKALHGAPDTLDGATLNLLGMEGGVFFGDLETWRLIETSEAFLDLIDGKTQTGSSDAGLIPACLPDRP